LRRFFLFTFIILIFNSCNKDLLEKIEINEQLIKNNEQSIQNLTIEIQKLNESFVQFQYSQQIINSTNSNYISDIQSQLSDLLSRIDSLSQTSNVIQGVQGEITQLDILLEELSQRVCLFESQILIESFKNYQIGDTYDFGRGDYFVTAKFGGSTPLDGPFANNTYESVRFSSNIDDTNSIWIEFHYSEKDGEYLSAFVGKRDTVSSNDDRIWYYLNWFYAPGYSFNSIPPFNNLCEHWTSLIDWWKEIPD
jgi:hypothetical protein